MDAAQQLATGGLAIGWDPDARLLSLRVVADESPMTPLEAGRLRATLRDWVGYDEPYRVLADCSRMRSTNHSLRSFFTSFFHEHTPGVHVAAHGLSPTLVFFMGLVKDPFKLHARVFASEDEARAWLGGVPAR